MIQAIHTRFRAAIDVRFHPLAWLLRLDEQYRQACSMRDADEERLTDMGISREQADAQFYTRFGSHRWTPRE